MRFDYLFENEEVKNNDIKLNHLICPCCGKQLRLIDSTKSEYLNDNDITINESLLTENKLSDYLLDIIETEAKNIFDNEIGTNEPETDIDGNIIDTEYGDRFIYVSKELKRVIKLKANAITNMLKNQGIEVSSFYIENELFSILKQYGYIGKR